MNPSFKFYEFFCGGGMARAGLGSNWECLLANDFDVKKGQPYLANWGRDNLIVDDVSNLTTLNLEGQADLAWASFPCQDLSLAGMGAGLKGARSGTFWPFWKLVQSLNTENRAPKIVVLENVCGALTSHQGKDFNAICEALSAEGYSFGAMVIDAIDFLPQSRPRLFIIGVKIGIKLSPQIYRNSPDSKWHSDTLQKAYSKLSEKVRNSWIWFTLPNPPKRQTNLIDLVEELDECKSWHSKEETERLVNLMSPVNLKKLNAAKMQKNLVVGTIYKRTRKDLNGEKRQRAEIRFDNVAGCLRTPGGGSSRQIIMAVKGQQIRSRLLTTREGARLMGLPDEYNLPLNYNDAYHLVGDGVAVPVVSYLAKHIIEPILMNSISIKSAA